MSRETTNYGEGKKLIAGFISTDQAPLAADTYYVGMPLEYDAGNDRYKYLATAANVAAIYNGVDEAELTAGDFADIIVFGEVYEGALVDDAGDAYTMTEDLRATFNAAGLLVKRK